MDKIIMKARAKINIALDVVGKRLDGYHDLKMIMQTVDLHDSILIESKAGNREIKLRCNIPYVPVDNRNIVYKITQYIIEKYNINKSIYINLIKNIPVASGLGGGSTDGASVLLGLNKIFNLKLSLEELIKIGEQFGADIPYCIVGGTALAEGIGEILTMLPPMPRTTVLICKPHTHISTSYVFKKFDIKKIKERPDVDLLIKAIKEKDIKTLAVNMKNVLETVTAVEVPEIAEMKKILIENGAMGSMMSGSGTSVFGLFESKTQAYRAAEKLKTISKEIFITNTVNE